MSYKVDNAIIMAAGLSSRFAPLSYEMPKGLIRVRGEVLIERQIKQLQEVGIKEIIINTGYQKERFEYLKEKFNVILIDNPYYDTRNNNYSLYVARSYLKNTYICSSDNYFTINPFESNVESAYYAAIYQEGDTNEWCMHGDDEDVITSVTIGGSNSWIMLGHVFYDEAFSKQFVSILNREIELEETKQKLWEQIFIDHIEELKMKIRRYESQDIYEFDTLDELRVFDPTYLHTSNSRVLKDITIQLNCEESQITDLTPVKDNQKVIGVQFQFEKAYYTYLYEEKIVKKIN